MSKTRSKDLSVGNDKVSGDVNLMFSLARYAGNINCGEWLEEVVRELSISLLCFKYYVNSLF